MLDITNVTTLLTILGVLVGVTNVLTEVIKKVTWDKIPSSLLALIISLVLTLGAFFGYCAYSSITIVWYYVAGAVVIGFLVAYAAMFGFDTLKEKILEWFSNSDSDDSST
jgi:purine-cytosine permease-like protein